MKVHSDVRPKIMQKVDNFAENQHESQFKWEILE